MSVVALKKGPQAYRVATPSPYHKAPRIQPSADASTGQATHKLRDWARWLDENHDLVTGALDKITNFAVGTGISIEPMVRNRSGNLLPKVNDQIRKAILDETIRGAWSRDVSVTGEYTRGEQEWVAFRTFIRDGEILARRISRRPSRDAIPYQVQLIECDYLPYNLVTAATATEGPVVHGVEKDEWGRPTFYHLYTEHPGDIYMRNVGNFGDMVRVRSSEIAHLKFSRRRVGQTRGVPIFHSCIYRLDDIGDYEDAHRIAARTAAQLMGALKRSPDMIDYDPATDERQWEMEHGQVLDNLLPGEDMQWYKAESPNPDAVPFLDDQKRSSATGFGIGYSTFSGKYDKSFSAARQEQSENWPNIETLRAQFVSDFVRPVEYEPALEAAIVAGRVRIPREADPSTIYAADYRGPARPTIDDEKQAKSDILCVDNHLDSRHGRIRERGRDPVRVDAEINSDMMKPKTEPMPANAPGQNSEDDQNAE